MEAVMNLNSIQINLQLGQEILVGKKQEKARITKIEHFEKSGDIVINCVRLQLWVIQRINIGKYLYEDS
jgi:hypothetical protein